MAKTMQLGALDFKTPEHDIPVRMYQEYNDGNILAVKSHFDDNREAHRPCSTFSRSGGIGAYGSDQEAYFKMWERISGWKMDSEGFLTKEGENVAYIEQLCHGRKTENLTRSMIDNYFAVMDYLNYDYRKFFNLYTPILWNKDDIRNAFKMFLANHHICDVDSKCMAVSGHYIDRIVHGWYGDSVEKEFVVDTVYIRTDALRRYCIEGEINRIREHYFNTSN